jgi:hypothetical protein
MANEDQRPRSEPEILPPERHPFGDTQGPGFRSFQRVHIRRIGPVGLFFGVLGFAVVLAIVAFLVAGFLLVVVPVVLALAVISVAVVLVRGYWNRPPGR